MGSNIQTAPRGALYGQFRPNKKIAAVLKIKNGVQKMWNRIKTWVLLYSYLSNDVCVNKIELPMGWIRQCKHRFSLFNITYYKIVTREIRRPIDDIDYTTFEVAHIEGLLPVVYMWAGFKLLLTHDGLYMHTRGADIIVSKDVTDLAAYVSAMIRRHGVAIDKQRYKEERKQELKSKYNYAVIA